MKVRMELLEDAIFGNGQSIPGEEDISVLCDRNGFPYYKGSTFKGVFREELIRLLEWKGEENAHEKADKLLGCEGNDVSEQFGKLSFSDFTISGAVQKAVLEEKIDDKSQISADQIKNAFTSLRTFTRIDEDGMVQDGSLRIARCINKGITFHGTIEVTDESDEPLVKEVLGMIKWIGTLRNRGFGKVLIEGK